MRINSVLINVFYSSKEMLFPRFGFCKYGCYIQIGRWLPNCVKKSVLHHELYHWYYGASELGANWYAFKKYPWGWFVSVLWTLKSPLRMWWYLSKRIFGNDKAGSQ